MSGQRYDVVIVGAGPGGLAAAAHARELGLDYLVLERANHLADTVFCYQARKHVMAEPGLVPLRSEMPFAAGSRESVLEAWQTAARGSGLRIELGQEVAELARLDGGGFRVTTAAGAAHEAAHVVLAIGTRGNPRRLGAPGEELPHVSPRLVDPAAHRGEDVLVVGAGDSALEVAIALAAENRVGLVVRTPEIVRAKESLEREILSLAASGRLKIHFSTSVKRIHPDKVELKGPEEDLTVPAQRVFTQIGATPPRKLLEGWGIEFTGETREALPVLSPSYESTVPGLYLIGAVSGRDLIKLAINQGYEVAEHVAGREVLPADEEVLCARMPFWRGTAAERIALAREEIPVLAAAAELQLREVFLAARTRIYRDGEVILRQNDYTDTFLAIVDGEVAISVRPEGGGAERRVATLSAGNFLGEMSLISGRRRNATATAVGEVRLIEVPRKAMVKLLHTAPGVKRLVDASFLIRAFQKYLFPQTVEAHLWELVGKATVESFDRDTVVFRESDPGEAFYLIRAGMVKISKRSGEREIIVSYLVAGNSFGETALLDGARRTATVTTIFPSELIRLAKADCDEFLERHPEARPDLVAKLEPRRIENLILDAKPRAGEVLHDLIEHEVVMGTDALIIDNHKCVRCNNCIHACEGVHEDRQARLSLTGITFHNLLAPNSCWQCTNPLCMLDCPPDAIVRNARGEVYIKSNCIGCGNCERNCPYDNIFMVHPKPESGLGGFLRRILDGGRGAEEAERQVAVKCDLCSELHGGPACVRSCPTGAAIRLDPQSYQQTIEEIVVRRGGL
jgi:CRP-like cAMP-binding protein/thioredoxin reductase/Fe-S-cluster-containing hydrogenase component 2